MKIGFVLDDTLDTPDGVQQYVLQVGNWLSQQHHEVHYLVGQTKRQDIGQVHSLSRNVSVSFNGNHMSVPLPVSRRRLRRFLAAEKFEVLHLQVPYSPFMAGQILHAAPADTAVIGTFHILPHDSLARLGNRLLAVLNRRSGRRIDRMLAVSAPAAQYAERVYGYHCEVVPNPVDVGRFQAGKTDSTQLNITFLGRLVERKGVQHLLAAVAFMHEHYMFTDSYQVHIGGIGPLAAELEAYVAEHKLQDIVTFDGFISETAKPDFLAGADLAVYPSTGGESFGIVLIEAMAAARGVVLAGNNPGYASTIPDANQLIDPTDTARFAHQLAGWLRDTEARREASRLQHEYVRQFDIDQVGRRLVGVYEQALQSQAKS